MRLPLSYVLFLACISSCWGYDNFQKGYIVLQEGDTIPGLIDNQMWENNPVKIKFRKSIQDPDTEYTITEVRYFFIENTLDLYYGTTLTFRQSHNALSTEVKAGPDPIPFSGFLNVLVLGKINLYKLNRDGLEYFFTKTQDELLIQLELRTISQISAGTTFKKDLHLYRNHLHTITSDYPELQKKAVYVNYGELSFTSFIKGYNDFFSSLTYQKKYTKKFYRSAGILISAMSTTLTVKDIDVQYDYKKFDLNSISPSFGGYVIFFQNKGQGKWGLYNELTYKVLTKNTSYQYNQGVFSYDADMQVRMKRLRYAIGLRVSTTKLKYSTWFAQGGLYMSKPIASPEILREWVRNSTQFPATGTNITTLSHSGYFAGIGYRRGNLEFEARIERNTGLGSNTAMSGIGIVAKWRLTKR